MVRKAILVLPLLFIAACTSATKPLPPDSALFTRDYYLKDLMEPNAIDSADRSRVKNELKDLITSSIFPNSWKDASSPHGSSPATDKGSPPTATNTIVDRDNFSLTVTANSEIHQEIAGLLNILREDRNLYVLLETDCFLVNEKWIKDKKLEAMTRQNADGVARNAAVVDAAQAADLMDSLSGRKDAVEQVVADVVVRTGGGGTLAPHAQRAPATSNHNLISQDIFVSVSGDRHFLFFGTDQAHDVVTAVPVGSSLLIVTGPQLPQQSTPANAESQYCVYLVRPAIKILTDYKPVSHQ